MLYRSEENRKLIFGVIVILWLAGVTITGLNCDPILNGIWNFLIVNEKPRPADVIIVVSGGAERVEHGIRLYQSGYADKLIFSGGSAERMKKTALESGVPEEKILLEGKSGTTFGNARYTAELVRAQGFNSAIVVTSPHHTRRVSILFREFFEGVELTVCSTPYSPAVAENWWRDKGTAINVVTEYLKLAWHFLIEKPVSHLTEGQV